jgi:uncharacterized protein YtpQ (UPF0354 family)
MRLLRPLVLTVLFICSACHAEESRRMLNESEFTRLYAERLQAAKAGLRARVSGDLEIKMTDGSGGESTVFLDNAYSLYRQESAEQRDVVLDRYVKATLESRDPPEKTDTSRIVPVIKDVQWWQEIRQGVGQRGGKTPDELVVEPLNEELVVMYAIDSASNVTYLSQEAFEETGVDRSSLRDLAIGNLHSILPKVEVHRGDLLSMIVADGNYEASVLLFDEFWKKEAARAKGNLVVGIPARDLLVFADSSNAEAVLKLREAVDKYSVDSPYRITTSLFEYRDGRFVPY